MRAEFEEKQYEVAASIELAAGLLGNRVFSSGQVLENILGYDTAADADPTHLIWRVLNAPRPAGVVLLPRYWEVGRRPRAGDLPTNLVSLILQFKRPDYMVRKGRPQWQIWNAPYYRFTRSEKQHAVLRKLEKRLNTDVLIKYAAPAFHTRGELESAQMFGSVLEQTGFASPSDFGPHKVWTYREPGVEGRPNPSGAPRAFESLGDLARTVSEILPRGRAVGSGRELVHLDRIAEVVRYRSPIARRTVDDWVLGLRDVDLGLTTAQREDLREYASIQSELARVNAHWWLVGP